MIILTGHGALASEIKRQLPCEIVSFRGLDQYSLEATVKRASIIVHNAANLVPFNLSTAVADNFLLTKKITDAIEKVNKEVTFIYISSMSVLATQDEYLDPASMKPYAFSKYLSEIYLQASNLTNCKVVRFSTIFYSDRDRDGLSRMVHDAVCDQEVTLFEEGRARRDFIPISIAVGYLIRLFKIQLDQRVVNIASGRSSSFGEMAASLRAIIPDLSIVSETKPGNHVLHDFSKSPLSELGVIDFRLEDHVNAYALSLK